MGQLPRLRLTPPLRFRWRYIDADAKKRGTEQSHHPSISLSCPPFSAVSGENLAWYSPGVDPVEVTSGWYSEVENWFYGGYGDTGHFTAMIWKGAVMLGCGTAEGWDGAYYVCHYGGDRSRCGTPNMEGKCIRSGIGGCYAMAGKRERRQASVKHPVDCGPFCDVYVVCRLLRITSTGGHRLQRRTLGPVYESCQ